MVDSTTVFELKPDVRHRLVSDEGVVLRQEAGEVMVVNEVGARVLELVDAHTDALSMIDVLLEEFEIDRLTLERDVAHYLDELLSHGVIQPGAA